MRGKPLLAAMAAIVVLGTIAPASAHGTRFHTWRHDHWRTHGPVKVCDWVWRHHHYTRVCWWR